MTNLSIFHAVSALLLVMVMMMGLLDTVMMDANGAAPTGNHDNTHDDVTKYNAVPADGDDTIEGREESEDGDVDGELDGSEDELEFEVLYDLESEPDIQYSPPFEVDYGPHWSPPFEVAEDHPFDPSQPHLPYDHPFVPGADPHTVVPPTRSYVVSGELCDQPCTPHEVCTKKGEGQYSCECKPGYVGEWCESYERFYGCGNIIHYQCATLDTPYFDRQMAYPHNMDCSYDLLVLPEQVAIVKVAYVNMEPHPGCSRDNITIYVDNQAVEVLCQARPPILRYPMYRGGVVSIRMRSNSHVAMQGATVFVGVYEQGNDETICPELSNSCGEVTSLVVGSSVTSMDFPLGYGDLATCYWYLRTPRGDVRDHVVLFTAFRLEDSTSCQFDFVGFREYESNVLTAIECGYQASGYYTPCSQYTMLHFSSDYNTNDRGFNATYVHKNRLRRQHQFYQGEDEGSFCGVDIIKSTGFIISPGYPAGCPGNVDIWWHFRLGEGEEVVMRVVLFELVYQTPYCGVDSLTAYDDGEFVEQFCGSLHSSPPTAPSFLSSSAQSFALRLRTRDVTNPADGVIKTLYITYEKVAAVRNTTTYFIGTSVLFKCRSGVKLISWFHRCDGVFHCQDYSDEDPTYAGCNQRFLCGSGEEIPLHQKCDLLFQCQDKSDENYKANCTDLFLCSNGITINANLKCDGRAHCLDGLDESHEHAGCKEVDACSGVVCYNGGTCVSAMGATCECTEGWAGQYCETDIENECLFSPCQNGGTCYPAVRSYHCVCDLGYHGDQCNTYLRASREGLGYVALDGGDAAGCGTLQKPCRSISFAAAVLPKLAEDTILKIKSSPNTDAVLEVYNDSMALYEKPVWIHRSLTIAPEDGDIIPSELYPDIHLNMIIDKASTKNNEDSSLKVGLEFVKLSGVVYIGNAKLVLSHCILENFEIRESFFRNSDIPLLSVSVFNSRATHFTLSTHHEVKIAEPLVLKSVMVECYASVFDDYNITVSANETKIGVSNSQFAGISRSVFQVHSMLPGIKTLSQDSYGGSDAATNNITDTNDMTEAVLSISNRSIEFENVQFENGLVGLEASTSNGSSLDVHIKNGVFSRLSAGLILQARDSSFLNLHVFNGTFRHICNSGHGGAISLQSNNLKSSVKILNSTFINNVAKTRTRRETVLKVEKDQPGRGGAIAIGANKDEQFSKSRFDYLSVTIMDSSFIDNSADAYGGTLYLGANIQSVLRNNWFSSSKNITNTTGLTADGSSSLDGYSGQQFSTVGDMLDSRGISMLVNNTFTLAAARDNVSVVSYRADENEASYLEPQRVQIFCPRGYRADPRYSIIHVGDTEQIETFTMYCITCEDGTYSLSQPLTTINKQARISVTQDTGDECLSCPYGAECHVNIKAKANFWGEEVNGIIHMYLCPAGICCSGNDCYSYDSCSPHREGLMCSNCAENYTESWFTSKCFHDSECKQNLWIWILIAVAGVVYVLLFLMEEEISLIATHMSTWFRDKCLVIKDMVHRILPNSDNVQEEQEPKEEKPDYRSAYLDIFMYYIQVPDLFKVNLVYANNRNKPMDDFQKIVNQLYSFNTIGFDIRTCLFKGVRAVYKGIVKCGYIGYMFVVCGVLYGGAKACTGSPGNQSKLRTHVKKAVEKNQPVDVRFALTFCNLLVYTYQYIAENSFILVQCVNIASSAEPVLYIDPYIKCYTLPQYFVIAFILVYVIPFAFALMLSPVLLKEQYIGVRSFLASFLVPVAYLPYFMYLHVKRSCMLDEESEDEDWRTSKKDPGSSTDGSSPNIRRPGRVDYSATGDAIACGFTDAYREDLPFSICWEGIMTLRRFILTITATFIQNALYSHMTLMLVVFFSVIVHLSVKPFRKRECNIAESASLLLHLFFSVMNLLKSAYFQSGEIPEQSADQLFYLYDYVEFILLGLVPSVVFGVVAVAVVGRCVMLLVQLCGVCCSSTSNTTAAPIPLATRYYGATADGADDEAEPQNQADDQRAGHVELA